MDKDNLDRRVTVEGSWQPEGEDLGELSQRENVYGSQKTDDGCREAEHERTVE